MTVSLRTWNLSDLDWLVKNGNNAAIAKNMTDSFPHPFTLEKAKTFVEGTLSDTPTRIFAILYNGELAGSIGLHPQTDIKRKNAEMGYWLAEQFWGKGIATEAVKLMLDYGFKHFDVHRIFARPFSFNIGSQKVLEKAGFQFESLLKNGFFKSGVFTDELIYSVVREEL